MGTIALVGCGRAETDTTDTSTATTPSVSTMPKPAPPCTPFDSPACGDPQHKDWVDGQLRDACAEGAVDREVCERRGIPFGRWPNNAPR
ncbi:hypothetical protein [Nocardia callitridis]|uniref:hypothetical protein n=1 Tax=Nocardia callitridis TaxID=648753 RepID=UPI0031F16D4F